MHGPHLKLICFFFINLFRLHLINFVRNFNLYNLVFFSVQLYTVGFLYIRTKMWQLWCMHYAITRFTWIFVFSVIVIRKALTRVGMLFFLLFTIYSLFDLLIQIRFRFNSLLSSFLLCFVDNNLGREFEAQTQKKIKGFC